MAQPKKPRQKLVTLKSVEKQFNTLNQYSTFILNEETNEVIKYYAQFSESKIENLIREAYEKVVYVEENKIGFFVEDAQFIKYVCFLMIKHFSHFGDVISESFDEQVPQFNWFIDTGLFNTFLSDIFPPEEVGKVLERIGNFASLVSQVAELESETRQKASESVQHPLMKKKLSQDIPQEILKSDA